MKKTRTRTLTAAVRSLTARIPAALHQAACLALAALALAGCTDVEDAAGGIRPGDGTAPQGIQIILPAATLAFHNGSTPGSHETDAALSPSTRTVQGTESVSWEKGDRIYIHAAFYSGTPKSDKEPSGKRDGIEYVDQTQQASMACTAAATGDTPAQWGALTTMPTEQKPDPTPTLITWPTGATHAVITATYTGRNIPEAEGWSAVCNIDYNVDLLQSSMMLTDASTYSATLPSFRHLCTRVSIPAGAILTGLDYYKEFDPETLIFTLNTSSYSTITNKTDSEQYYFICLQGTNSSAYSYAGNMKYAPTLGTVAITVFEPKDINTTDPDFYTGKSYQFSTLAGGSGDAEPSRPLPGIYTVEEWEAFATAWNTDGIAGIASDKYNDWMTPGDNTVRLFANLVPNGSISMIGSVDHPFGDPGNAIPVTFDGQGNTVTAQMAGPLFLNDQLSTIKNLTRAGQIQAENSGGILGTNLGTIENCISRCTTMSEKSGGIAYENQGTIRRCTNNGVIGTNGAGIVYSNTATVELCANHSEIKLISSGGIVCKNIADATVSECINTGNITTADGNSGGIAMDNKGTVVGCINTGNITVAYSGGIVRSNSTDNAIVIACINTGTIENQYSGGIASMADVGGRATSTIVACLNKGATTKNGGVGGIIADAGKSTINACLNVGGTTEGRNQIYREYSTGISVADCYTQNNSANMEQTGVTQMDLATMADKDWLDSNLNSKASTDNTKFDFRGYKFQYVGKLSELKDGSDFILTKDTP